ncbi:MAG TPA: CoA transferase, partial [Steroidobacteraceae bacterium]|nr:CoA transferase [Steroidobacteraceae bacterium]
MTPADTDVGQQKMRFGRSLLLERSGLAALESVGKQSWNGTCRLLESRTGWIAVNLARARDRDALPALLGREVAGDPWLALEEYVAASDGAEVVELGRLLGMATACARRPARRAAVAPISVRADIPETAVYETWERTGPLVIDLSALWAGPLCGHILASCGARVIKVESIQRPDVARLPSSDYFARLQAGKELVTLDFDSGT